MTRPHCSAPGCRLVVYAKGQCRAHWYRDWHRDYMRFKRRERERGELGSAAHAPRPPERT